MTMAKRLRFLRMGLQTVLGLRCQGVFIPYRHADELTRPVPTYAAIEALFKSAKPDFADLLKRIDGLADALRAIGGQPAPAPRWDQQWFPRLDAAVAYTLVRKRRPRLIVETGSGHSTRFMARAITDGDLATRLVAIDPAPRAGLAGLPVKHHQGTVQSVGLDLFRALAAGDVLFVDSSHLALPGSDVDVLFGRVLPGLPAGVLVHIHDVLLPDDYPASWRWRGYNEQQAVAALLAGGGFKPIFASHYAATRMAASVAATVIDTLAHPGAAPETSLWLEKTAPPLGPIG